MSERTWFFAFEGKQHGPYPEAQFREMITRGVVTAETLVWSNGMAGWQKAGEVPGLISAGSSSPAVPRADAAAGAAPDQHGSLSIDLPMWSLLGRFIVYVIGLLLVIPAPWVATSLYRWMASRIQVPGRPNFAFDGEVGDIWYVFILMGLMNYAGAFGHFGPLIGLPVSAFLQWMTIRWIAGRLSSNGEPLPIAFTGSALTYIGWCVLCSLSFITIIGWAWVMAAWMRWICRNIIGTRHEIVFKATGLDLLWRTLLFVVGCVLVIPMPWVLRWNARWLVSQFALGERRLHAVA